MDSPLKLVGKDVHILSPHLMNLLKKKNLMKNNSNYYCYFSLNRCPHKTSMPVKNIVKIIILLY